MKRYENQKNKELIKRKARKIYKTIKSYFSPPTVFFSIPRNEIFELGAEN